MQFNYHYHESKITFPKKPLGNSRKQPKPLVATQSNKRLINSDHKSPKIENNPNHQIKTKIRSTYLRVSRKPFPPNKIALLPNQIVTREINITIPPTKIDFAKTKTLFREAKKNFSTSKPSLPDQK